ncbi:hypothetical protein C5612_30145 [Pseudomonas frederiksbergensis]|uniref:Uncharacterized protein n=1 Tax=Pseudomonas frederiksbergensis TaxID=104087 RepID=A0A2S8H4T7_9PSED|nr:hypothetical protein [Pseudomonas frederiksbergensis]PQO96752.1 hypothetical protein C5612_30145 [Pseudomonas frederiksbergensis]
MDFSGVINSILQFGVKVNQTLNDFGCWVITAARAAIVDEKSAVWVTLVTDIITIAAALGALALPISLNVIEATRTRYRSPSLLKITSSLSGIDAKKLNQHLFMVLAVSLAAKLIISIRVFDLISLVPYLCALTVWFGSVVYQVYRHLKFTYTFMSNIEEIHERIYRSINNYAQASFLRADGGQGLSFSRSLRIKGLFSKKVRVQDSIAALIELESYLLCTDSAKVTLDSRITDISYKAFNNLDNYEANEFARHLLASLPSVLAAVEVSREVDVYQSIAGFYLYLAMGAILSKEEYRSQIGVIERIARFREEKLPSYGRFCRNGRLFLNFANKTKSSNEAYTYLQEHFNFLIETSVREQPANIPELLSNVRYVIQFKGNYQEGGWGLPKHVAELWGCSCLPEFDSDVADTYAGRITTGELKERIETKYKPEMQAYLEVKISDKTLVKDRFDAIDVALDKCWKGIALKKFSSEIETGTLRALATLLSTHPEIVVECRELRNPAGSRSFNVGHSPVPTSLGECIGAFLSSKNFGEFYTLRLDDLQEYKIVDAIGALIVYELWSTYILGATGATIKPEMSTPTIPTSLLGELKDATQRVPLLKTSLLKTLANDRFIDRLGVLPEQALSLREYACKFCDLLGEALEQKTKSQIASQKLDLVSLERFKREVVEQLGSSVSEYSLFKRLTLGQVQPIVSHFSLPRVTFLSGTDTHYIFDMYGSDLAREVHDWLSTQILLYNHRTENSEFTLPTRKADWMICSSGALKKFLSVGFATSGRNIIWPDGKGRMKFIEVDCDGSGYYLVLSGESLLTVSYEHLEGGLPIDISFTDNGESVSFKIEYFVNARR